MSKLSKLLTILLAFFGLVLFAFAHGESNTRTACTQEAKVCSDDSSVGRIGPKCEFAAWSGLNQKGKS